MSWMVLERSGEPLTKNLPRSHTRSSSSASRRWAASLRAFSRSCRATIAVAAPATGVLRDAYVPSPYGAVSVSPSSTATSGADDLGEARDADAGDFSLLSARLDVFLELGVPELIEGDVHRLFVLAAVIDPARCRVVRKLLGLDEVLLPELGLVDAQLEGCVRDQALDQVARLGNSERAAIRHAAWRLVRVVAIGGDVRGRDVVGARDDVEQARFELAWLCVGEERAVVAVQVDAQREHLGVRVHREVAGHVEVAREAGGDEVLVPVLDPLHRPAEQETGGRRHHVAWVDRDLVAEAPTEVRGDDADVLLRQAGHEREHRPDRVRSLTGHVDRGLARGPVDVGDAPTRLERGGMAAGVEGMQPDHLVRPGERRLGGGLVARL